MKRNSIYILILFCIFSINVFAEREAKTPIELRLLEAISKDSTAVADQLINEGASAKLTDIYGQSLLMFAAQNNNKELVNLLIKKGANPNYTIEPTTSYNEGRNNVRMLFLVNKKVIDFGIMTSDTTMVNLLIDQGAKLDVKNKDLGSAVAKASQDNNVDMVRYLLKKGAKVSDKTGQFLVVWYILLAIDLEYPYNSYRSIDKNTDFRIIKIWDDYGIPLDDDILTRCSIVRSDRDRNKIKRYMATYREWVANGAIDPTLGEQKKHSNSIASSSIPIVSNEPKIDSISNIYKQKEAEEKALKVQKQKEARNKEWILFIFCIAIIIVSVVFWNKISYYSKQLYDRFKQTAFYNRFCATLNPPVQPQPTPQQPVHKKPVVEKAKSIVVNKRKVDQPIILPEKGWKVDDTINIEINYLTIEDMINPIRLANEYERDVREMIWYIRKIEIMSEEEKSKARFHKKEVSDTLSAKWKQVNPKFVRSVYKRSLVVILENYSEQNSRVNLLIKEVKSKIDRK